MGFDLGSGSGPVYPTDVLSHDDNLRLDTYKFTDMTVITQHIDPLTCIVAQFNSKKHMVNEWNASPSPISSLKNTSPSSAFTQTLSSPAVHNAFFLLSFSHFEVRNEKAGRYLRSMRLKKSIRFSHRLPHDDLDLRILQKLLSFELNERPTVEEHWYVETLASSKYGLVIDTTREEKNKTNRKKIS
ncbi:hypothetical protein YC2023_107411 [Brassica napus]